MQRQPTVLVTKGRHVCAGAVLPHVPMRVASEQCGTVGVNWI
jgi:hypothetical protein